MLDWQEAAGNRMYRKSVEGQIEEEIGAFLPMAVPLQMDPCWLRWDHSGSTQRCAQICLKGLLVFSGRCPCFIPCFLCLSILLTKNFT